MEGSEKKERSDGLGDRLGVNEGEGAVVNNCVNKLHGSMVAAGG